jgi:hypothetical protein
MIYLVLGNDLLEHRIGLYVHKGYIISIPMVLRMLDLRILGFDTVLQSGLGLL